MKPLQTVGIDVGGTFSDFVFHDSDGNISILKRLSTPAAPSQSMLAGLQEAKQAEVLASPFLLTHGTTVATNALLERKGAKTALITTKGFRDVLEIGRQNRDTLYAFHPQRALPLIPRTACFEIAERVDWLGNVLLSINEEEAIRLLQEIETLGYDSVAVCFIFGYLNPINERIIGKIAKNFALNISLSSDIAPEPREFERTATTVANAFVAPVMSRYLESLAVDAAKEGASHFRIMQSNGGTLRAKEATEQAIKTVLSGPAGGVVASIIVGKQAGFGDILTFDMGGTSTDVALIRKGKCPVVTTSTLNGIPIRTPQLDIHTVGAGGGSLARLDRGGGLRVGPESAGAVPGPVAYGVGERLCVTDANVLLGRLPSEIRLGGTMCLDSERVREYGGRFAQECGLSLFAMAQGILEVANSTMARALRHISVERGHDPAQFALLSFGGAGGLHACDLADALGIRTVLVPRYPGAFSALGLVLANVRRDYAQAIPPTGSLVQADESFRERLQTIVQSLLQMAETDMEREGLGRDEWVAEFLLDLRYVGQSFALSLSFASAFFWSEALIAFHKAHLDRYGYANAAEPVEAVAVRLIAAGTEVNTDWRIVLPEQEGHSFGAVEVCFAGTWQATALYHREEIAAGQTLHAPAIILQSDSTTLIPPSWQGACDDFGNLILSRV
ncbi:MAG: hydantoinase/oxoprolinase family protein [Armatimonadetes bacterium]|nr:hydantoinase/oxoprolinase family protein [Armatimonadota bacterium]